MAEDELLVPIPIKPEGSPVCFDSSWRVFGNKSVKEILELPWYDFTVSVGEPTFKTRNDYPYITYALGVYSPTEDAGDIKRALHRSALAQMRWHGANGRVVVRSWPTVDFYKRNTRFAVTPLPHAIVRMRYAVEPFDDSKES